MPRGLPRGGRHGSSLGWAFPSRIWLPSGQNGGISIFRGSFSSGTVTFDLLSFHNDRIHRGRPPALRLTPRDVDATAVFLFLFPTHVHRESSVPSFMCSSIWRNTRRGWSSFSPTCENNITIYRWKAWFEKRWYQMKARRVRFSRCIAIAVARIWQSANGGCARMR